MLVMEATPVVLLVPGKVRLLPFGRLLYLMECPNCPAVQWHPDLDMTVILSMLSFGVGLGPVSSNALGRISRVLRDQHRLIVDLLGTEGIQFGIPINTFLR